jgi:HD-GYP domain-containing protein (c-di-GMP phosphodiesterase class II)
MRHRSARAGKSGKVTQDGEAAMTDTHVLLGKIAALRQRLDQAQGLARDAGSAAAAIADHTSPDGGRVWRLERRVSAGGEDAALLDGSLRQLTDLVSDSEPAQRMPRQLTARARRVIEQTHQLLSQLRVLADQLNSLGNSDLLNSIYRETSAMTEMVLRVVQAFPDSASAQLRFCDGVEAILKVADQRIGTLAQTVSERRHDADQLNMLTDVLSRLASGQIVAVQDFIALANELLAEASEAPLRLMDSAASDPATYIAAHSLAVARVMARIVVADAEFRTRPMEPVLAALVHDVGMLRVPVEILLKVGALDEGERRAIERHTLVGADLAAKLLPSAAWLSEATGGHHERLDGTGYPGGLRDAHIAPLTRLLAVCDVYTALCSPRPHRPQRDSRTALADTLLLADQGALDPREAERLLLLSFYPVGAAVELADGAVGVVVATHMVPRDLNTPARPVVLMLTDDTKRPLPMPKHMDLAANGEGRNIVRTLTATQRREALGKCYPEFA